MTDLLERIVGPVYLDDTPGVVYTAPPDVQVVTVRAIHVASESDSLDALFTLAIGLDGPGLRFARYVPVRKAGGMFDWSGSLPLAPGEKISAHASVADVLTLIVSAVKTQAS